MTDPSTKTNKDAPGKDIAPSKEGSVAAGEKSKELKVIKRLGKVSGIEFKGNPDDGLVVSADNEDSFANLFNCDDWEQASLLLSQIGQSLARDEMDNEKPMHDFRYLTASLIRDIAPRDAFERMLVTQMVATHVAVMRSANLLSKADTLARFEIQEAGYNRLCRTFTAQMESLRKHRHGGKQTVTVQHVNVEDGGQAIVGNVETTGGQSK